MKDLLPKKVIDMNLNNKFFLEDIIILIICLIPLFLITGPFLPDLALSITSIYFIYITYKLKLTHYYTNKYVYFFLIFYFYILIRSFFSVDPLLSLEHSLFFFRYLFFVLAIIYLSKTNKKFIKYFTLSLTFTFVLIVIDGYIQFFLELIYLAQKILPIICLMVFLERVK